VQSALDVKGARISQYGRCAIYLRGNDEKGACEKVKMNRKKIAEVSLALASIFIFSYMVNFIWEVNSELVGFTFTEHKVEFN